MKLKIDKSESVNISVTGFNWRLVNDLREPSGPYFEMEYSDPYGLSQGVVNLGTPFILEGEGISLKFVLGSYAMLSSSLAQSPFSGNYKIKAILKKSESFNRALTIKASKLMKDYLVEGSSANQEITYVAENKTDYEMLETILEKINKDSWLHWNSKGGYSLSKPEPTGLLISMKEKTTGAGGAGYYLKNRLIQGIEKPLNFTLWTGEATEAIRDEEISTGYYKSITTTKETYEGKDTEIFLIKEKIINVTEVIEVTTPNYIEVGSTLILQLNEMTGEGTEIKSFKKFVIRSEYVFRGLDSQGELINRLTVIDIK